MNATSADVAGPPQPDAPGGLPAVEWRFNPWRERPGLAALAAVLALGGCVLVASLGESPVLTLGLSLAAVASFAPLFCPTLCRVDGAGIARRGPLGWSRRPWSAVRRARLEGAGLLVSPYERRSWLDPYRALFLPLPGAERERLRSALAPHVQGHDLAR